jgi:hypothetical protein
MSLYCRFRAASFFYPPDKILIGGPSWLQVWVRRIPANFVRVAIIRIISRATWYQPYDDRWVPSIVAISYGDLFTYDKSGHPLWP